MSLAGIRIKIKVTGLRIRIYSPQTLLVCSISASISFKSQEVFQAIFW